MTDVINFWSFCNVQLWSVIVSNWILSISVLIIVIGWIINMVNTSRNSH